MNKQNKEKEIPVFVDYHISENCLNMKESFGEVCVKCGKCGRQFNKGILIKNKWDINKIIPEEIDLLFTGKGKLVCSRQAIVNLLSSQLEEIEKGLESELCEWMRKEGYSNDYSQMKKQDILEAINKLKI